MISLKPLFCSPMSADAGTRQSSKSRYAVPLMSAMGTFTLRVEKPGASRSTSIRLRPRRGSPPFGPVTTAVTKYLEYMPLVIHFLLPLSTYESPSRRASSAMPATSDPALGSLMASAISSRPMSTSGATRRRISSLPKRITAGSAIAHPFVSAATTAALPWRAISSYRISSWK